MNRNYASRQLPLAAESRPSMDSYLSYRSDTYDPTRSYKQQYEKPNNDGCLAFAKDWYSPVYSFTEKDELLKEAKPRYCNGRLGKKMFLFAHCVVIGFLMTAIMTPIMYAVVIPNMIRDRIANTDLEATKLEKMDVDEFTANGMKFSTSLEIGPQFPLPLTASLDALTAYVETDDTVAIAEIHLPPMADVTISQPIRMAMSGDLFFNNPARLSAFIGELSSGDMRSQALYVRTKITITMFGIVWYRDMDVERKIVLPALKNNLIDLYKIFPRFMFSDPGRKLREQLDTGSIEPVDGTLTPGSPQSSWWQFLRGFPPVQIRALDIAVVDSGIKMGIGLSFANPMVLSMSVSEISLNIKLENAQVARMTINGLALKEGMNNPNINVTMALQDPSYPVSAADLSKAAGTAIRKILSYPTEGEPRLDIAGPVVLAGSPVVSQFTQPLAVTLPIMAILENANIALVRNLITPTGIKSLLNTVKLDAAVTSSAIHSNIKVVLPRLIPLPEFISFPYTTSISVFGGSTNCMKINTGALSINSTDNEMTIKTSVAIIPTNTEEAAVAFGEVANPILAGKNGTVGIKEMSFMAADTGIPFAWSTNILGAIDIQVPVPANLINVANIIGSLTSNGTEIPLSMIGLDVSQMTTAPGFAAIGDVSVRFPTSLPVITMDVGFVQMETALDTVLAATATLGNGLKFAPTDNQTHFDAQMVLNRDQALSEKIDGLLNFAIAAIADNATTTASIVPSSAAMGKAMEADAAPPIVQIQGLRFGPSSLTAFQTFTKIVIPVDLTSLKPAIKNMANAMMGSAITPGMVKVSEASLAVISGANVGFNAGTTLRNPFPISAALGTMDVTAFLGEEVFTALAVAPITLQRGIAPLNLQASMTISRGDNGMSEKVAEVVGSLIKGLPFATKVAIGGIVLTPQGAAPGSSAIIDQLKDIKVIVPASLFDMIKNPKATSSPLDISALLPGPEFSMKLPTVQNIRFNALPGSTLSAGAQLGYVNPLPLAVQCGFFVATASIDEVQIVKTTAHNIQLVKGPGSMNPSMDMKFLENSPDIPTKVNEAFRAVLDGHLQKTVGASAIYFGSSAEDANDIFSLVSLSMPVSMDTKAIVKKIINLKGLIRPSFSMNNGGIHVGLGAGIGGELKRMDLDLQPSDTVAIGLGMAVTLPLAINMNIPFLKLGAGIDNVDGFITKLSARLDHARDLSSEVKMIISDTDPLARKIAAIADAFLASKAYPGEAVVHGLALGVSESDHITAFKKVSLRLGLDGLLRPITSDIPRSVDVKSLLNSLGLKFKGIAMETIAGKSVKADLAAAFTNPFPVSATVNYAAMNLGMDDILMVIGRVLALKIGGGAQSLALKNILTFPSLEAAQDKVAEFVGQIVRNGLGTTSQTFFAGGIKFGHSEQDTIDVLRYTKVHIPSAALLNRAVLDYVLTDMGISLSDLTMDSIMKRLVLEKAELDVGGQPGAITADVYGGLKDFNIAAKAKMDYVRVDAFLNNQMLAKTIIPGFKLESRNNAMMTAFRAEVAPSEAEEAQYEVKALFDSLVAGGTVPGTVGAGGLVFGKGSGDQIDLFRKAVFNLAVDPFVQQGKAFVKDIVSGNNKNFDFVIKDATVKLLDRKTIGMKADVDLKGLPQNIGAALPYASVDIKYNDGQLVQTQVQGMTFTNSKVEVSMAMVFAKNVDAVRKIGVYSGDILFHRPFGAISDVVSVSNPVFGASASSVFKIASKVNMKVAIDDYVHMAYDYVDESRPVELINIQSKLTPGGIAANVTPKPVIFRGAPLPLTVDIPSITGHVYYQGTKITVVYIKPYIKKGKPMMVSLLISPTDRPSDLHEALADSAPKLLAFESYSRLAHIGGVYLNFEKEAEDQDLSKAFDIFEPLRLRSTDLYLFDPIDICNLHILNPFKEGVGMTFTTGFSHNNGSLHAELGHFEAKVLSHGKSLAHVRSLGPPIVVKNKAEGMASLIDVEAKAHFELKDMWVLAKDLVTGKLLKETKLSFEVVNEGLSIGWLNDALNSLPNAVMAKSGKVLLGLYKHSNVYLKNPFMAAIIRMVGGSAYSPNNWYKGVILKDTCAANGMRIASINHLPIEAANMTRIPPSQASATLPSSDPAALPAPTMTPPPQASAILPTRDPAALPAPTPSVVNKPIVKKSARKNQHGTRTRTRRKKTPDA